MAEPWAAVTPAARRGPGGTDGGGRAAHRGSLRPSAALSPAKPPKLLFVSVKIKWFNFEDLWLGAQRLSPPAARTNAHRAVTRLAQDERVPTAREEPVPPAQGCTLNALESLTL